MKKYDARIYCYSYPNKWAVESTCKGDSGYTHKIFMELNSWTDRFGIDKTALRSELLQALFL